MKLLVAAMFVLATALPAKAEGVTQITWDRTGAEHLPCSGDVQWTLAPGDGILEASVGINDADGVPDGHSWTMQQAPDFSRYITTTEPVAVSDEVLVAWTGEAVTQPTLSLVDCVEAVTEPPAVPVPTPIPTTNPAPTPPTESPTVWTIGFKVRTHVRTNVVAKYRIVCDGVLTRGRVKGMTPLSRTFTGFDGSSTCNIIVRSWDVKPWNGPHGNGQTPIVTSWVNHS